MAKAGSPSSNVAGAFAALSIMSVLLGFIVGAGATLANSDRWTTASVVVLIVSLLFALYATVLLMWGERGGGKDERGNASGSNASRSAPSTD